MVLAKRLTELTKELMLIPGLSGYETRVRKRIAAELKMLGIASRSDRAGNLIATLQGDGKRQQGTLYVTAASLAFHGSFGMSRLVLPLAQVVDIVALPDPSSKVAAFALSTAAGDSMTVNAVAALGGAETAALVRSAWLQHRSGGGAGAPAHAIVDVDASSVTPAGGNGSNGSSGSAGAA